MRAILSYQIGATIYCKICSTIIILLFYHNYCLVMGSSHHKVYYRSRSRVDFSLAQADDHSLIRYTLFKRENPQEPIILTEANVTGHLNRDVKTILILHGWTTDDTSPWYAPLKDAYFLQNDHNVIYVDWSAYGNLAYEVSAANVEPVGEFIALFLLKSGVPAKSIHLVGHSLGSHLFGFTGKSYERLSGQKIGRITALDPAGPKFENEHMTSKDRLCENDADLVDVIHTDIQMYGYTHPCGHVDFYPNGGTDQPGCPDLVELENCNHHRSTRLFIESVNTKVTASEIDMHEDDDLSIHIRHKKNGTKVIFGEHVDPSARGLYYFETSPTAPFLREST